MATGLDKVSNALAGDDSDEEDENGNKKEGGTQINVCVSC